MIAQDFFRVRVLGAFSRGARGATPRKKTEREGPPLASIAMPYGVATMCAHAGIKCPTGGAFGAARGPAPPCEGAASAVCFRQNVRQMYVAD